MTTSIAARDAAMADTWAEHNAELRERVLKRLDEATPVRYRGIDAPEETAEWREAMLANKPANLILVGPTGTGKTCAVWSTLRDLLVRGWDVERRPGTWSYYRATDLAAALRPNDGLDGVISAARKTPLLIVDDLGSAKLTDWQLEQLTRIVDYRWENVRPTVITSNVPVLREVLDDRLASRLQDNAVVVALRGADRRRGQNREVPPTAWTTAAEIAERQRGTAVQW